VTPGLAARKATDWLVVHCSASPPSPTTDWKVIDRWHRQRGFLMIGYHYVIKTDGTVETTAREKDSIGAHVEGFNRNSIGICMVGGVDNQMNPKDNFTPAQYVALEELLRSLRREYVGASIRGHRDFPNVAKACPSFDCIAWVKKRNIQ
jgi:N-acetyl-anhydromuramyl-L-alanine amidase AmpD